MEAPDRSAALPRSKETIAGLVRSGPADGARGVDRRRTLLGDDQLRRRQREGGSLRGHDDQRTGVEDSRPSRRFSDPGCRPLCRWRCRRRGFDRPRRSEPLQSQLVRHRRRDAAGRAPEGRGYDRAEARGEEHYREEATYAVCTENGPQTLKTDALFEGKPTD